MQIFLVGGAIRDQLLGLPIKDKDFLVVGATEQQMLAQGYQKVGKDFPVFLHPKTKQEYALARTERKVGQGYLGFECDTANVSLEQDLLRRDLTINAVAQDDSGQFFDPYGGIADIKNRLLRHVSPAFSEDPLRVLRVARFAAKLAPLGFHIASETKQLMKQLGQSGELKKLTTERLWQEMSKALTSPSPSTFIQSLYDCGALEDTLPQLHLLFINHPQQAKHMLAVLDNTVNLTDDIDIRFAALTFNLATQTQASETVSTAAIQTFCQQLKVPNSMRDLTLLTANYLPALAQLSQLSAEEQLTLFSQLDLWRKPERLKKLLTLSKAHGLAKKEKSFVEQNNFAILCFETVNKIKADVSLTSRFKGNEIANQLKIKRIKALNQLKST